MGVDCRSVSGFGLLLTHDELDAALEKLGITFDHDEPEYELSEHYGLPDPKQMGTRYRERGTDFLYCAQQTYDSDTGSTTSNPDHIAALKRMSEELGLNRKPQFHEGELWY